MEEEWDQDGLEFLPLLHMHACVIYFTSLDGGRSKRKVLISLFPCIALPSPWGSLIFGLLHPPVPWLAEARFVLSPS